MKKLDSPEFYTIAWIAALPIERAAAEAMLDEQHGQPDGFSRNQSDPNSYTWGHIGEHNVVIVSLAAGVYGLGSAAATASSLASSLPAIRIGLLVGIGGGIARPDEDHDIRLGDVVVSQPEGTTGGVCQYDLVKAKPGDVRERKGFLASPPRVLLNALANIQSVHERKDSEIPRFLEDMLEAYPKMAKKTKKNPGYTHQGFENDRLFQSSYGHVTGQDCRSCKTDEEVQREERDSTDPEIHYGIIASGNTLVKDAAARDQILADIGEDCICFEMEAAGLMNHFPCLVIRGICDYAESHKNDRWQRYASGTAAAYAKELLAYVPAAEIHETKRAWEILQSVNERLHTTRKTTLAVKSTVGSLSIDSRGQKMGQWLDAPDPNANANHARELRHHGTGAWLLGNPTFQDWISGTHRHLWLRGMPGCGKTVLSTIVLDHLTKDKNLAILSFFFDFSDELKQTKNGLLRSLALQLFQGGHDTVGYLDNSLRMHQEGSKKPSTATLEELVHDILATQPKVVIVLDALDESNMREEILSWLKVMFSATKLQHVQVMYTSREEAEFIRNIPSLIGGQCCLSLSAEAIDADILSYVMTRIQSDPGFTTKPLSEDLLRQIHSKVGNGATGMFRWAACQLDSIARCLSPNEVERTLDRLPATLEETYNRMLQSIPEDYWKIAIRLLQFVVFAKRPLTLKEAVEIVATNVEDEQPLFDPGCRMYNSSDVLRHCPSLLSVIVVRKRSEAIHELHLAHFSVKEYLLLRPDFGPMNSSITITKACLIYLRDIEGHRWRLTKEFPLARYAAEVWMEFAATAATSRGVLNMILAFLQCEEVFDRWLYLCGEPRVWPGPRWAREPIQHVPGSNCHQPCVGKLEKVMKAMVNNETVVKAERGLCGNMLQAASYHGHLEVVRLLLGMGANIDALCKHYGTALQAACYGGHIDIVRLLIKKEAVITAQGGKYGNALQAASRHGHIDIVRLLLGNHADVNAQGGQHGNALTAASGRGHLKIVELLLDHNAEVNAPGGYVGNALCVASANGHLNVVQTLLKGGADVHTQYGFYGTALNAACKHGHLDLARHLLNQGADIHTPCGRMGNALQAAADGGNESIVKILVEHGADINATGSEYGGALQAACSWGNEKVVTTLLNLGADANAPGGKYGGPLHAAYRNGNKNIVETLKRSGADVHLVVNGYGRILRDACRSDATDVAELLADLGIDVAHDSDLDEYLQIACFFGSDSIVEWLVDVGATDSGWTPITAASAVGNIEMVKLLLEKGANVSIADRRGRTTLHNAVVVGNFQVVRLLLEASAHDSKITEDEKVQLIHKASSKGKVEMVNLLLEKGFEVSATDEAGWTPLYMASSQGNIQVVDLLLYRGADLSMATEKYEWTPLHAACWHGHVDVISLLLEKGADVSRATEDGLTPLILASYRGNSEVVSELLDSSEINANHRDHRYGRTALSYAAEKDQNSVVELLLTKPEVDVDSKDSLGRTALFYASIEGYRVIVDILIDHHASADSSDRYGSTPLSLAARRGHRDVVLTLLSVGAIRVSRDIFHRTPMSWAKRCGQPGIVEILAQDENQDHPLSGVEVNSAVNMEPRVSKERYCDVCTLDISRNCSYYDCSVCNAGDFDICKDCFTSGGRCLGVSHPMTFKKAENQI
ncbi:Pfs NACHT and Ankyrin domain protein [Colletotrichum asianum]